MSPSKVAQEISPSNVWVVGEVLVDLIPSTDGDTKIDGNSYKPIVGGGPANTARAISKWGVPTSFIGGFSSDRFGHIAWSELTRDGVDLDLALESDLPTAKALLTFDEKGKAEYRFEVESTATFDFRRDWLPTEIPSEISTLIHFGSLATVVQPGADALFNWLLNLRNAKKPPVIIFDPNVRTTFLDDPVQYREQFERWIALTDLVKASDEDLSLLYPEESYEAIVQAVLKDGPSHLVITCGENGIEGFTTNEHVTAPTYAVEVMDTVGAGDTVGAVIAGEIAREGLDSFSGDRFQSVLDLASRAAAITCSRQGANTPTREEYDGFWRR
jgi:fructokinase